MDSVQVESIIRIPENMNHVVYAILHDKVLTGKLKQIDISERDGIWYVVELNVNNNQKLTCEFCDDDVGIHLFADLHSAQLRTKNVKKEEVIT